jgi:hypothetical protein
MADGDAKLSKQEIARRLALFLVNEPLYRRSEVFRPAENIAVAQNALPDAITQPCAACRDQPSTSWTRVTPPGTDGWAFRYKCLQCGKTHVTYFLFFESTRHPEVPVVESFTVRKVGQWPAWFTGVPRNVEKALDKDELELYRKGATSIAESYGIGALAYFRRAIEDAVPELLDLVEDAAKLEQNDAVVAAVARARESKRADEKLKLAADALPASLRIGGVNPLARLFDRYSAALHTAPDNECLETAKELKRAFDYVFVTMRRHLRDAQEFAKSLSA